MKAFNYLIKTRFLHLLNYRIEVVASFFLNLIPVTVMYFLWRNLFNGETEIEGLSLAQVTVFSILSVGLKDCYFSTVDQKLSTYVYSGNISLLLLRPYPATFQLLADDVGLAIANFIKKFIPLVILAYIVTPALTRRVDLMIISLISLIISFFSIWFINATVGALALRFTHTGALNQIKDQLLRTLSGAIIPIWFFPDWYRSISEFLPFHYFYQLPLGVLIEKINMFEACKQLGIQLIWLLVLFSIYQTTWNTAERRLQIQGG